MWETQKAFEDFSAHMKGTALKYLLRGVGELTLGGICLLVLVGSLFGGGAITPVSICVVGFFLLITDALVCFGKSRKIGAFK